MLGRLLKNLTKIIFTNNFKGTVDLLNMPLTDLELIDKYCEECLAFIDPGIFREIRARGLYSIINMLPNNVNEAKAVARARMRERGKYFNDSEIDQIAGTVQRLEFLRQQLQQVNMSDAHVLLPILDEMKELAHFVSDYFKPTTIP
jgi:hypothetical protein